MKSIFPPRLQSFIHRKTRLYVDCFFNDIHKGNADLFIWQHILASCFCCNNFILITTPIPFCSNHFIFNAYFDLSSPALGTNAIGCFKLTFNNLQDLVFGFHSCFCLVNTNGKILLCISLFYDLKFTNLKTKYPSFTSCNTIKISSFYKNFNGEVYHWLYFISSFNNNLWI